MLIRLLVKNLFSFKELTEFNMLPGRFNRLPHHVYTLGGVDTLKLGALYGANGAGKSNMIHALAMLSDFVQDGEMPIEFITETFKLSKEGKKQDVYIGVEFIKDEVPYYYGLTMNQGVITEEELQISGLGKKEDKLLFLRTDAVGEKNLDITFSSEVMTDKEAAIFPSFLKNELLERNQLVISQMKKRKNKVFDPFKRALDWFESDLEVILPESKPGALAIRIEKDKAFSGFADHIMQSFGTGVESVLTETIPIEEFFGEDDKERAERITADLRANPDKMKVLRNPFEEVVFILEDNKAFAKKIVLTHKEDGGQTKFQLSEESDGTRRLLDYLPLLHSILRTRKTYLVDEIERSIHALLIKELVQKFSHDTATMGQLIFSTHESNLLDQDIFRPDEIWFAEKNKLGATELYPLSEFKEHHTLDIRKGYLNGRYGGIPFLGNLKDLNWDQYAEAAAV